MLKIGITGGIGSGKTIVCQVFETLGIPVFYADTAAKWLMEHDEELVKKIKQLAGNDVYVGKILQREKLASIVFNEATLLSKLNALVHPATILYGKDWMNNQTGPYALKEAAILFESGSHKELDAVIGVHAPLDLRIRRSMERDHSTRKKIEERIAQQMDEEEKMKLCDYVIVNDDVQAILPQVWKINAILMQKALQ